MRTILVVRGGRVVRPGQESLVVAPGLQVRSRGDLRHKAHSLPIKGQDPFIDSVAPRFDEHGVIEFHSKREIEEFAAATGRPYDA